MARSALPRVRARELPRLERRYAIAVADYFRGMGRTIEPGIRRVVARRVEMGLGKASPTGLETAIDVELRTIDWDQQTRTLSTNVRPVSVLVDAVAASAAAEDLGIRSSFDVNDRPLDAIIRDVGTRVRAVTATSRRKIAAEIADGIEKGLSVEQIVKGVRPGTTNVRGPVPAFRGIRGLVDSWASTGTPGFAGAVGTVPLRSSRAYLIALTETGNAFNRSAIETYQRSGLVDFVEVFDGPDCGWTNHDDPDLAHGSLRSLADAKARPLSHPRCQRAFGASLGSTSARPSPFAGRDPGNVPGATPGLRPDDLGPLSGRAVPRAPAAVSPFRPAVAGDALRLAALETAAERIRYTTTHETAVVVDDQGRVLIDKADPTKPRSVDFTPDEVSRMRGSTITHNHPGAYQTDLPHSTAFSPDDGDLLVFSGAREIRAVGRGADHTLSIKPGTFASGRELRIELAVHDREVRSLFSQEIAAGTRTIKSAEANHWHESWTRLAARFPGVEYRRVLRPEKP